MNWKLLTEIDKATIERGYVFRFSAEYPFEEFVDFMIIEDTDAPIKLKMICSSGYHSGQTESVFPLESGKEWGLSTKWLIENWEKWIYPKCNVDSVMYIECYTASEV